jgi:hypothetical protein
MEHPQYGKEMEQLAEDLVRRGPAAGIIAISPNDRTRSPYPPGSAETPSCGSA